MLAINLLVKVIGKRGKVTEAFENPERYTIEFEDKTKYTLPKEAIEIDTQAYQWAIQDIKNKWFIPFRLRVGMIVWSKLEPGSYGVAEELNINGCNKPHYRLNEAGLNNHISSTHCIDDIVNNFFPHNFDSWEEYRFTRTGSKENDIKVKQLEILLKRIKERKRK